MQQRLLATVFAMLAALAALAIPAQPAAADPAGTVYITDYGYYGDWHNEACITPNQAGVLYQYGAWGYFIDGCMTRKASCPAYVWPRSVNWCKVTSRGQINTQTVAGHRVTLNSRLWLYDSNSTILEWWDKSCQGFNLCTPAEMVVWLRPGQQAATQCNGVRENRPNTAHVECDVRLDYYFN